MINDDDIAPASVSSLADTTNGVPPGANEAATVGGSGIRTWALVLSAGLAVGLLAWAIGEAVLIPDSGLVRRRGNVDPLASDVGRRNAVVSLGVFGAVMGLGLGLAGGLVRRSIGAAVLAGTAGLILAGVTGAGLAWRLVPIYYKNLVADDLTYPLIVHGGTWGAVGAVAGLAFGLGLGGWRRLPRVSVGGAGAALLATVIYEVVGAIFFPLALTDHPVSATRESRLLAQLLVAVLVAAGVALCAEMGERLSTKTLTSGADGNRPDRT